MDYKNLKDAIKAVIKKNGAQEITGQIMQDTLLSIVSKLGGNKTFAGVASPTTVPDTTDANIFYIAGENGTYVNFGGAKVENEAAVFVQISGGTWRAIYTGIQTSHGVNNQLQQEHEYFETEIDKVSADLTQFKQTEFNDVKEDVERHATEIAKNKSDITKINGEIATLNEASNTAADELVRIEGKVDANLKDSVVVFLPSTNTGVYKGADILSFTNDTPTSTVTAYMSQYWDKLVKLASGKISGSVYAESNNANCTGGSCIVGTQFGYLKIEIDDYQKGHGLSSTDENLKISFERNKTYTGMTFTKESGVISVKIMNTENLMILSQKVEHITDSLSAKEKEIIETNYSSGYINKFGGVTDSVYANHSDFVELKDGVDYYIYSAPSSSWFIGYYREKNEDSFISSQQFPETSKEGVVIQLKKPTGAKFTRTSVSKTYTGEFYKINKKFINVGEECHVIKQRIEDIEYKLKPIYRVGANGDFSGIHEAFAALKNNDKPKIIYIDGGEYDLYAEMGGESFIESIPEDVQREDWPLYSNYVPDNTDVIGIGQVCIKFLPPKEISDTKKSVICPMAFRGAVKLENISIEASNCRYCVHDEAGIGRNNQGITKMYKNVHLRNLGGGYNAAYGAGFQKNNTIIFDNCSFYGPGTPWSTHDNYGENDYTTISISNSLFISESKEAKSIVLKNLNGRSGYKQVYISNCVLSSLSLEDLASLPNRYKVKIVRCGDVEVTAKNVTASDYVEIFK